MRRRFRRWVWVAGILLALVLLPACIPGLEQAVPLIVLDPTTGSAGTSVSVTGSGFPPSTQLRARLGPPSVGATPHAYGSTTTDADGRLAFTFAMPGDWPDGTPITETDLVVVLLNEDGSVKATAPFSYVPSSQSSPILTGTPRQVTLAWHREGSAGFCGDVVVYEGRYVEVTSCGEGAVPERRALPADVVQRLRGWTEAYQSFELEQTQGTGASRITTRIAFVGNGMRKVSDAQARLIQMLLEALAAPK